MPSLHWICVLTLAMICCLTAQPVKRNAGSEPEMMLEKYKVECDAEAEFYTPENFKDNCLGSALNCYLEELAVINKECETVSGDYNDLLTTLLDLHDENKDQTCPAEDFTCEFAPEKNVTTFLKYLKSLVQRIEAKAK